MTDSPAQPEHATRPSRFRKRLRWLVVVGGTVIGLALLYVHFFLYLPVGSGPAGPIVDRTNFEQRWTDRPVLLVGLGDSVTAGFGATKGHSYFDRLVATPGNEFPELKNVCLSQVLPNLKTENLAISGSNSCNT